MGVDGRVCLFAFVFCDDRFDSFDACSSRLRRGQNLKIEVYEKVEEKEETPMLAESTTPKETAENEPMTAPEAEKEPVTEPEPEKKTTSAPENPEYHKVQRGETLAIIANKNSITQRINHIMAGDKIFSF